MSYHLKEHPTIGPIKGISKVPGVIQFFGVQYATLKDRFSRGVPLDSYPSDRVLDATKLGPIPLSPENGCEWEQALLQHSLPCPELSQSDTECLTLNFAVPEVIHAGSLPVLLMVHGGAFVTGSSSYPQYDLARITKLSIEVGNPIIAIGVNYRLGVPGFLYSSAMGAAGYKPNNGVDDQRLAMRWVKRHIAGFGGDPDRITFMGESAGGASGCFHLHSAKPLFQQLISMSGTSLLPARSPELLEKSFDRITQIFGMQDLPPTEQVKRLLAMPMHDLRSKVGRQIPVGPMVDGDLIPGITKFSTLANDAEVKMLFPGIEHCKRILVGDCAMDSMALAPRLAARRDILAQTLIDRLAIAFADADPTVAVALAAAYELDPAITSNTPKSKQSVLNFGNDVCFAAAAQLFARAWGAPTNPGTEAFLYRFNCPNPWEGPWKGHATHILDIAFALLNYTEYLPDGQRFCSERLAKDIILFANGAKPWAEYAPGTAEGSMVYDSTMDGTQDVSNFVKGEVAEGTERRYFLQKIVKPEHFDRLMQSWQLFMAA
ncbi:Alpha/Beta hydrolase protein [Aspergillus keveii]|uniref:Alpha/Beta hydrolase protein n=1 Tax=Aspergillus keveii TaxID=714993 RepID=A0ABR4FIZ1_9EURO